MLMSIGFELHVDNLKNYQEINDQISIANQLIKVYQNGGKIGAYKSALKELNLDITNSIDGFDITAPLPWDVIENYPSKQILINEYNRLLKRI